MSEAFSPLFAIDGTWIYPPDGYQEEPVPVVGTNLKGEPVRQGYPTFTFTWSFLKQSQMTALMLAYTPEDPKKTVRYIDKETGELATMTAMMHEPIVGARQTIYYANVAVRFTRCETV